MGIFKIILWARAKNVSIESMADIIYKMLCLMKEYGDELDPKYITVRKKILAKEFNLNRDSVKLLLEKKVDKEGLKLFNQLTSRVSFFSSLDDNRSSGISIGIGDCGSMLNNTCVVSLPTGFSGLVDKQIEFIYLFKQLIEVFEPYFGFVSNNSNKQYGDIFWLNDKPTYVHWINYYDTITAKKVGLKSVLSIEGVERFKNGYFFMLQDEPIDVNNPQHLEKQRKTTNLLGL